MYLLQGFVFEKIINIALIIMLYVFAVCQFKSLTGVVIRVTATNFTL